MPKKAEVKITSGGATRPAPRPPPQPLPSRGPSRLDALRPPPPPPLDLAGDGAEHRQFPRALLEVPFRVWIGEGDSMRFSATLRSTNLSVSGVFLASSFFLPMGTELSVSFEIVPGAEPVRALARIVREEREGADDQARTGFGLRFIEFFGQTEVSLAKLFLGHQLSAFAETYLQSQRARSLGSEMERVVDALAAWELQKVTSPRDPWRPLPES